MRQLFLVVLLWGASAAPAPALAQDASAPPEANFTGPRVELLAGYDRFGGDGRSDGVAYGGAAGYDFDLRGLVLGVEGEFVGANIDEEQSFSDGTSNFTAAFDVGRDLYVGGRIGFRATPTTLVYGKAGYTNTRFDIDVEAGAGGAVNLDGTIDGYRLGVGVEQVIRANTTGNIYAKLEYLYSNYGNVKIKDDGFDADNLDIDVDIDRQQVMAGIGIRF